MEVIMFIDRDEAKSWFNSRIMVEIGEIRRKIAEEEVRGYSPIGYAEISNRKIDRLEDDIKFLNSLL